MAQRRPTSQTEDPPALSTSLGAFEVIARGGQITVESAAPIDPQALAEGLRLATGHSEPVTDKRGRRVTLAVDGGFPLGANTLHVGDLYTPDFQRIDGSLEVPFFVIETKAKLPANVRVHSHSRVAVEDGRLQPAQPRSRRVFELMKGQRRDSHAPWEGAYDADGKPVDFDALRAELWKARLAQYGKLQPALHRQLARGAGKLNVAIWLRAEAGRRTDKSPREAAAKPPASELAAEKRAAALLARFVADQKLAELDKALVLDTAAPVVYAELPPDEIRRLAGLDEVASVFLHQREGIDDLGNSIAIAQSAAAHSLGYNGTRINVAVYESGPDDTTNLSITAAFESDPDTSQHARHTHGIIKNIEPGAPHGHAPDCRLHSANSKDLAALRWAAKERGCTVISQSFHREEEQTSDELSFDDVYKDWLALHWPYPTICEAAGNGEASEFVNHKGYNRLTVANHNDSATTLAGDSVFRNPASDHGDRELPEIAANGTGVTAVGLTLGGTSMAAPAVAGATACVQEVNGVLKSWPEGCRAIQLAAAKLNPTGGTWWNDVNAGVDGHDGSGALNTLSAVRIAEQRKGRNNAAAPRGWDVGTLRSRDFGEDKESTFAYHVSVPRGFFLRHTVKVALAWDSDVIEWEFLGITIPLASVLTLDLDLLVYDSSDNLVGYSCSWDNSYEIAEFPAVSGETYRIKIRRWYGTDDVWFGLAWNTVSVPLVLAVDLAGIRGG